MKIDEITLFSALKKQIDYCCTYENYRCGIFVTSIESEKIVIKILANLLNNLLSALNNTIKLTSPIYNSIAQFDNGSRIRIQNIVEPSLGTRFNGIIIQKGVPDNVLKSIIQPTLIALVNEEGNDFDKNDKPYERVYKCSITQEEDIVNAMTYNIEFYNNNYITFKKEYEEMYNRYDTPVVDKEVDSKRYLLYEAWGIPSSAIAYETEFVNKTKDMFLNVNGKVEDERLGFENDINIHLYIDTDIYDGFEVSVNDGMVKIVLHEIENEQPVLMDLSFAERKI